MNNGEQFFNTVATTPTGYEIERSLRFNSSDSAFLSRTPASAGNRKTWTWAGWVKRSGLGTRQVIFNTSNSAGTDYVWLEFRPTDVLWFLCSNASVEAFDLQTIQVFRDVSSWYHICIALDTTQATSSSRAKVYVNGVEVTTFSSPTYPSPNSEWRLNTTNLHAIGRWSDVNLYSGNFYLADIHFIDGQALDPTSFGEFDDNGIWQPIEYTGSYGTNGFHLPFSDNSTAAALGTDTSGNGNTWTVNNISVTAGAGNDSLVDVPTNGTETDTGVGGEVRGNYCTWNPLDQNGTLSNGNLDFSNAAASNKAARSTFALPTSDKWYAEFITGTLTNGSSGVAFGFANSSADLTSGPSAANRWTIYADATGYIFSNGSTLSSSLGTFAAGTVLQIAFDGATGKAWVGKNNVWYNSSGGTTGDPAAGTNQTFTLSGTQFLYSLCFANSGVLNAGARPFAYTAPSGFKALCTANLPAPVVTKPSTVMDVVTYTGTGATRSITGLGFSPDLVWIKSRSFAESHRLLDTVRTATKVLYSDLTNAEGTDSTGLTAFNSDGFTLGSSTAYNQSTSTYVAWTWDAGSSTVSNTDGSITSTVRANTSAGFSIVSYTGNGSAGATIGHGLGAAPAMIIVKCRNVARNWTVGHQGIASDPWTDYLTLNSTAAAADLNTVWNDTAPTSTVFTVGTANGINANTETHVAYCFAPVDGYSSFGSYTGNGSADGPFVYTGFRPRWLLIKSVNVTGGWALFDSSRDLNNAANTLIQANRSFAEAPSGVHILDMLSNGFKLRGTGGSDPSINPNSSVIYAAFAENPFALNARAR